MRELYFWKIKKIWIFCLFILLWWIALFLLLNCLYKYPLPTLNSQVLKDTNGQLISGIKIQGYETSDQIPKNLKQAVVGVEDRRYYLHLGIDPIAVLRAIKFNLQWHGRRQWASTIPQQLVKITRKSYHRTWSTKIKEMLIAFNLSLHHSKDEILLAYLNNVEFLNGIRGYRAACLNYFQKECSALFPSELSFLIATAQTGKNPLNASGFKKIKTRAKVLCPLIAEELSCKNRDELPPVSDKELHSPASAQAQHFNAYYQKSYSNQLSSFNLNLYQKVGQSIAQTEEYRSQAWMWDCCVLVLNEQGDVETMNTCRAFDDKKSWEVNWCLSKRQTGSAIKPFLYIFALQKLGLTWGSMIVDEPVSYYLDEEQIYSPKNFSLSYYGEVSLATALGSSLNIPAVKLLHDAGVEEFIAFINRLRQEIANTDPDVILQESQTFNAHNLGLSVGLGTYELSPLEFASLWKVFLTSWALADEYQSTIAEVADILSKNQYRTISFWVDNYLNMPGWSVKSGTSRHFIDGWTCWVHTAKKKILCVWAGNYDASPMKKSWSLTAGYLWNLVANQL